MTEFITVFEIATGPSEIQMDIYLRLGMGFVALALAISLAIIYLKRRKTNEKKPKLYTVIVLHVWAIGWLCFTVPWFISASQELDDLRSAYQEGYYQVVEGPVRVLRTQPTSGHAPGDLVEIGEIRFEINYFVSTHAYHLTIAHGGHLQEGVYAKVFYQNGDILRIDVKK